MRKLILVLFAVIFFACEDEGPIVYMQFTSDDLAHLYYDKDTLTKFGQDVYYTDTVFFLLNGTDTIRVPVHTEISSSVDSMFLPSNQADIFGTSQIMFNSKTGFEWAIVNIGRGDERLNCGKYFEIGLVNGAYSSFTKSIPSNDSILILDTALVLNQLYKDVYKYYGPVDKNYTRLKTMFFAKKFGFIKIESIDGKKLELIKIMRKDTINSK